MSKGYYWIPPVDTTLNGMQYHNANVIGRPVLDYKRQVMVFRLDRYFPVGSIFYFAFNNIEYHITCRLKKPGLWYEATRVDGERLGCQDIERFTPGRYVRRKGTSIPE